MDKQLINEKIKDNYKLIQISLGSEIVPVFFNENPFKSAGVCHAEFYSYLVSETGYFSHFFFPQELSDYDNSVERYLTELTKHLNSEVLKVMKKSKKQGFNQLALL